MPTPIHLPVPREQECLPSIADYERTASQLVGRRRPSRRRFLKALASLAAVMAMPTDVYAAMASRFLASGVRLPVIWLEFQDCTGDTESFLRAASRPDLLQSSVVDPGIVDLLLNVISLEYHETLMSAAGVQAELARSDAMTRYAGKYLVVVEGSIPTGANGGYCTIGGKSALSIARDVCANAKGVMAVGACGANGGLPCAAPNPTTARSVLEAIPALSGKLIHLPGCPANVVNMTAAIVYFDSFGKWPPLDALKRPTFAHASTVHSKCFRREREEASSWTSAWHRNGGCLEEIGCRGPSTRSNCPTVKWNGGMSFPIAAGHGCIGCTESKFWDTKLSPAHPLYHGEEGDD